MTKEQELMQYLRERVFDPVLNSPNVPGNTKSGISLTVARMSRLRAEKMVQYFWSALITSHDFPRLMRAEGLTRFEDVMEDFRERFDDAWIRK